MTSPAKKPHLALVVTTPEKPVPAAANLYFRRWKDGVDPYPRRRPLLVLGKWSRSVRRWFYSSNRGGWA